MKLSVVSIIMAILFVVQISNFQLRAQVNQPDIPVPSALIMEPRTGTVIYQKEQHKRLVPASLVKIMTLLLTFEFLEERNLSLDTEITVTREASLIGGRQVYLKEGEAITIEELIKSVAIFSANDAAYALAQMVAGTQDRFVDMMNQKAQELGLKDTHFNNSHGLPEKNSEEKQYTTAYDLAQLARYIFFYYPEIFNYTSIKMDYIRDGAFQLLSTNKLLGKREGVYGLKTGYIRASGFCVVTMARQDDFNLIVVVMGAASKQARFSLASRLLDYGFSSCSYQRITKLPEDISVPVLDGLSESVSTLLSEPVTVVIPHEKNPKLEFDYQIPRQLTAPVTFQQWVGEVIITVGDDYHVSSSLIAVADVPQDPSFSAKVKRFFRKEKKMDDAQLSCGTE